MILSMTGFAAEAAELPGLSLSVELRSVNHRYLDVTVRLPDELRHLEPALRERLSGDLKRGKIECRVALARTTPGATTLAVDAAKVAQLADAANQVSQIVPTALPLSINEILRWPGVLAEPSIPAEELAARVAALVDRALTTLAASRRREGAKFEAVLKTSWEGIGAECARRCKMWSSLWTPTLAAFAAALPPEGELFAPWEGPAALKFASPNDRRRPTDHASLQEDGQGGRE